ncbi:FG-GAP repeat protein, partial [Bacteroidota bacterium]|nr:FG-GAP repeat protein [Bacteroidota bacterium]
MRLLTTLAFLFFSVLTNAQNNPFSFIPTNLSATLYGQAQINGVEADSNDWIAAFDSSGNCAGASQIINFNSLGYINLVIYGDDPVTPNIDEGITGNEDFFIKIYDASENLYLDFPTYDSIISFTGWSNTNGAPLSLYNNPNTIYNFTYTPVYLNFSDSIICTTDDSIVLSSGFPSGGVYSGNGIINNVLFPNLLNVGNNMITYTLSGISESAVLVGYNPLATVFDVSSCSDYNWNGVTYSLTGTYYDTLSSSISGCDSIITLNLTINSPTVSTSYIKACDSYSWNGNNYSLSGVYQWNGTNYLGCDSTAILNLNLGYTDSTFQLLVSCDSIFWNGYYLDSSGIYSYPSDFSSTIKEIGNVYGSANNDNSGKTVKISRNGNILAISSPYNDNNYNNSGQVNVYEYVNQNWIQRGGPINGNSLDEEFGSSLALSHNGNILAIGTMNNDDNGVNSGQVKVFKWNGSQYMPMGNMINGDQSNDKMGSSVSLNDNGTRLCVGAKNNDGNGNNSGQIKIFEWDGSSWIQLGSDIFGVNNTDRFGFSTSLSSDGNIVAAGAIYNDGGGANSGHVRLFEWDGLNWNQLGNDINGESADDRSGYSISLSGNGFRIAIGAPYNESNDTVSTNYYGHTRVYDFNGINWSQVGNDIDGTGINEKSGSSVDISLDGNLIAVSSPFGSINGNSSGHTVFYNFENNNWTQFLSKVIGESNNDQSGSSVSINKDGSRIAIGSPLNDNFLPNSGNVKVVGLPILTNNSGCDSTITLDLTINSASTSQLYLNDCDSIVYNGNLYTQSITFNDTITNLNGCDSIIEVNITIFGITSSTTNVTSCNNYLWNGIQFSSSGNYQWQSINHLGCDSIAYLNLVIVESDTSVTNVQSCDSYVWNGTTYTSTGSYIHNPSITLTGSNGCDSIAILQLTIYESTHDTINLTECDSFSYNGVNYYSSSHINDTLTNSNGCDSVIVIDLTINNSSQSNTSLTVCDSTNWNGFVFYTTGSHSVTLTNNEGCDSIAYLNLTVNNSIITQNNYFLCQGDTLEIGPNKYYQAGTYSNTYQTTYGCDSVSVINIVINQISVMSS